MNLEKNMLDCFNEPDCSIILLEKLVCLFYLVFKQSSNDLRRLSHTNLRQCHELTTCPNTKVACAILRAFFLQKMEVLAVTTTREVQTLMTYLSSSHDSIYPVVVDKCSAVVALHYIFSERVRRENLQSSVPELIRILRDTLDSETVQLSDHAACLLTSLANYADMPLDVMSSQSAVQGMLV